MYNVGIEDHYVPEGKEDTEEKSTPTRKSKDEVDDTRVNHKAVTSSSPASCKWNHYYDYLS